MRTIARYGWKPSYPDPRDKVVDITGMPLANEVDPRGDMPAMYNQSQLGSCTSNAVAAAMQYDMHVDGAAFALHRPSRLMLYYQERMIEGSLGQGDTGAYGRDGFKALKNYGWVPEREWPYHISRFQIDPPNVLWSEAATRKLTKPYAVVPQDEDSIVAVLSHKQTIAFGFSVFESFESTQALQSGIVPMPGSNESMLGGHEMLMIGYLESQPSYVLCRNSWGTDIYQGLQGADVYGGGYLLMPWEYIEDPNLTSDLRTIVR